MFIVTEFNVEQLIMMYVQCLGIKNVYVCVLTGKVRLKKICAKSNMWNNSLYPHYMLLSH